MKRSARSAMINGDAIREIRQKRCWTQLELARRAGYSSRLVRKAENGGSVDFVTLSNLAEALSIPEEKISPQQLLMQDDVLVTDPDMDCSTQSTSRHLEIAKVFLECYDAGGTSFQEKCGHLFTEDAEFHCPAEPEIPFAGVWRGTQGFNGFFEAFYGLFSRRLNSLFPEYMNSDSRVVARYMDQVFFQGHEMPPFWVNLHFQFREGLCCRVDDEFDHHSAKRSFEELMHRLGVTPPTHEPQSESTT